MGKITRGRDGRLYHGKGTKGGLAPSGPKSALPATSPKLPQKTDPKPSPAFQMVHPLSIKPRIDTVEPPEALQYLTDDISEYAEEVEFANHNDGYSGDWMTLRELLDDNKNYKNNCDPLSSELAEYLNNNSSPDDEFENISTAQLHYGSGMHAAVRVEIEGEPWVLDYTARQFDEKLPVPLILPQHKWEALIDHHIWTKYSDERKETW